jgi:hypothetical protein
MIGGLITSAFLTLEVIPVLYTIWRTRQLAAELRFAPNSYDDRSVQDPQMPAVEDMHWTEASGAGSTSVRGSGNV